MYVAVGFAAEDAVVEYQLYCFLAVDREVGLVGDYVDDYGHFGVAGKDDGADG